MKKKFKVRVAWSSEASDLAQEKSWLSAKRKFPNECNVVSFNTKEERAAYIKGIEDAGGWNEPCWEIVN